MPICEWSLRRFDDQSVGAAGRATGICMLSADTAHATQPCQAQDTAIHRNTSVTASTHLDWPFFEPRHRQLASALDEWADAQLTIAQAGHGDAECRALTLMLGRDGWLGARELRHDSDR